MASVASIVRSAIPGVTAVVSDNSTNPDDAARLRDFCARQPPGTVDYVEPPKPLAMPAHWEWLWGHIEKAVSPSHVSYLTDRMVFAAGALAELVDVISAFPEHVVSYHLDHVNDASSPVELVQTPWTGQLLELDCAKLIELSSRGVIGDYLPLLMTSIAPAETVGAIEQRFGDVFGTVSPDYRFAYRCLALCDTVLYLDRPCLVQHGMHRSAGVNYIRGNINEDAADFGRTLTVARFGATPEPAFETISNAIFQEYCGVRHELGGDRFPAPDWRGYLTANAIAVERIEEPEWRARMQDLLRRRGWTRWDSVRHVAGLSLRMAAYLVRNPAALARTIKRQLWDRPPGTALAFLLPKLGLDPRIREDLRFESAAEAIAYADSHPRAPTRSAWHVDQLAGAGAIVSRHRGGPGDGATDRR